MPTEADWVKAYNNFNPDLPLTGEAARFYVPRGEEPVTSLKETLLYRDAPIKLLLTGHRGCGKSTELRRVFEQLQPTHFTVLFSVFDDLAINDLQAEELLLAMGGQLYLRTQEEKLKLDRDLLRDLLEWFDEVTQITTRQRALEGDVEVGLKTFVLTLLDKLKLETVTRTEVRQRVRRQLHELVARLDALIAEVETRSGRRVLIGVDDLDKPDLAVLRGLFENYSSTLTQPDCKIVYTILLPLVYAPGFTGIARSFAHSKPITLPVTRLRRRDGTRDEAGYQEFREIVAARVPLAWFEPEALDALIAASGGDLRQFVDDLGSALLKAPGQEAAVIDTTIAASAIADRRNQIKRAVSPRDFPKYRQIQETRWLEPEERAQYLDELTVLEYLNEDLWYDVHPLLAELIAEYDALSWPKPAESNV